MSVENPFRARPESLDTPRLSAEVFKKLERRVRQIAMVRKAVESLSSDEQPEKNEKILDAAEQAFLEEFPQAISEQAKALYDVMPTFSPELFRKKYAFEQYRSDEDPQESDQEDVDTFCHDPVMVYIVNILSIIEQKRLNVRMVTAWKRDPFSLVPYLQDELELDIEQEDIVSVKYLGCMVNIVVRGKSMDAYGDTSSHQVFQDAAGFHYAGTPISLTSFERETVSQEVMKHEQVHAFLDGSLVFSPSPAESLAHQLAIIDERKDTKEEKDGCRADLLAKVQVWEIVNASKEELLAEMRGMEGLGFRAEELGSTTGERSLFERAVAVSSTAGEWMEKVAYLLRRNQETQKMQALKSSYVSVIQEMESALVCGGLIGTEAVSDVHALFLLLEPSQYKFIGPFLEKKYPTFDLKGVRTAVQVNASLHPDPLGIHRASLLLNSSEPMSRKAFDQKLYERSRQMLDDDLADDYEEYYAELLSDLTTKEAVDYLVESYHVESRMQGLFPKMNLRYLEWAREEILIAEESAILLKELATRSPAERELFKGMIRNYFSGRARFEKLSWRELREQLREYSVLDYVSALNLDADLERLCPKKPHAGKKSGKNRTVSL